VESRVRDRVTGRVPGNTRPRVSASTHPVGERSRPGRMARCRRSRVPVSMTWVPDRVGCSVFLNNRYYNPTLGVFLSVDPLVSATGDPYLYAAGNPTTFSDPSGLDGMPFGGTAMSMGTLSFQKNALGGWTVAAHGLRASTLPNGAPYSWWSTKGCSDVVCDPNYSHRSLVDLFPLGSNQRHAASLISGCTTVPIECAVGAMMLLGEPEQKARSMATAWALTQPDHGDLVDGGQVSDDLPSVSQMVSWTSVGVCLVGPEACGSAMRFAYFVDSASTLVDKGLTSASAWAHVALMGGLYYAGSTFIDYGAGYWEVNAAKVFVAEASSQGLTEVVLLRMLRVAASAALAGGEVAWPK
jgi:RHS repeat-associated protein